MTPGVYSNTVTEFPKGIYAIIFDQVKPSNFEVFFFAKHGPEAVNRIRSHMNSLTDDQCDAWLNVERIKAKQEAEREALAIERKERAEAQKIAAEAMKLQRAADKQKQKEKRNK